MSSKRNDDSDANELSIVAHRGFRGIYSENTLTAFEAASGNDGLEQNRADMIELDVRPCADGTIVVFHDTHLGRLTEREGFVREMPAETVLWTEVLDNGQIIPSLEQALDTIPSNVGVLIELKSLGSTDLQRGRKLDLDLERSFGSASSR